MEPHYYFLGDQEAVVHQSTSLQNLDLTDHDLKIVLPVLEIKTATSGPGQHREIDIDQEDRDRDPIFVNTSANPNGVPAQVPNHHVAIKARTQAIKVATKIIRAKVPLQIMHIVKNLLLRIV